MELRRFLAILTTALVIMLIIAAWFFPLNEDFRIENPLWNGAKDITASYPARPLDSLSGLPTAPQGTTLILIPYVNFTPIELEQINRFVTDGGRLVIADDYGQGNQLLEHLGLKARFTGQTLLDPLINCQNEKLPRIIHLDKNNILTANTESLAFNHATCLENVTETNLLASSSSFSFLDLNSNGIWEETEPTGPLPVISRHSLGQGQVILISDPSLLINGMEAKEDNANFIQNMATTTTCLYIDQSHLPPSELHQTKHLLIQMRNLVATPLGTSVLVILALVIVLKPIWHKRKEGLPGDPTS